MSPTRHAPSTPASTRRASERRHTGRFGATPSPSVVPPGHAGLTEPDLIARVREAEARLHFALKDVARARLDAISRRGFRAVDALLCVVELAAVDGAPFAPDAIMQRHATAWVGLRYDALETGVALFARAHAAPPAVDVGDERAFDRTLHVTRGDAPPLDTAGLAQELSAEALQVTARELIGPATWIRSERGYLGRIQPSPYVRRPRDGTTNLAERIDALATWAEDGPRSPLLTAAVVYAGLRRLHPFRVANRRMALHAADRVLRRLPLVTASRMGLGRALARRDREATAAIGRAVDDGAWGPWIDAFVDVAVDAVADAQERWRSVLRAARAVEAGLNDPRLDPKIRRRRYDRTLLAAAAVGAPYLSIAALVTAGVASRKTAGRYLGDLVRTGIGAPVRAGPFRLVRVSAVADAYLLGQPEPRHATWLRHLPAVANTLIVTNLHDD